MRVIKYLASLLGHSKHSVRITIIIYFIEVLIKYHKTLFVFSTFPWFQCYRILEFSRRQNKQLYKRNDLFLKFTLLSLLCLSVCLCRISLLPWSFRSCGWWAHQLGRKDCLMSRSPRIPKKYYY